MAFETKEITIDVTDTEEITIVLPGSTEITTDMRETLVVTSLTVL